MPPVPWELISGGKQALYVTDSAKGGVDLVSEFIRSDKGHLTALPAPRAAEVPDSHA